MGQDNKIKTRYCQIIWLRIIYYNYYQMAKHINEIKLIGKIESVLYLNIIQISI